MIFDIINNSPTILPASLTIPELKKIWNNDTSEDKSHALEVLSYIYHSVDPKSPYANLTIEEREETVIKDLINEEGWKPNEDVQLAKEKYKLLSDTPLQRLYESVVISMDKISKALKEEELDIGKQGNMSSFTRAMEKSIEYGEAYLKLKDMASKEITSKRQIKGGIVPSQIL